MRMEWIKVKSLAIFVAISLHVIESEGKAQVPCFFIFGDSLSDSGNNNNLATMSKANFLPYGIDFPDGPTGRFTNGRTVVDFIGDFLGLEDYIPPFSSVKESDIIKGVNYASASSGILEETGYQVGMRIGMDQQMKNHEEVTSKIAKMMGSNNSSGHLNKCLYSANVGSNDWMVNYFIGTTAVMRYPNNQDYAQALITQLSQQLTKLYNSGARKVIVFGLTPLGCLPTLNTLGRCSDLIDGVLEMFNTKLRSLVDTLNTKFKDANFIWINSSSIVPPNNFQSLGFKVTDTACCNAVPIQCIPSSVPCANREDHAFWDNAHMTQAAYRIWATRAFNATQPTDAYPMDINHLCSITIKSKPPRERIFEQLKQSQKLASSEFIQVFA